MKMFELFAGSSVLIYGAGMYGQQVYHRIKSIYKVECFVDKRVRNIDNIDLEVNDIEHILKYKESVVLVCVHNANWHYDIAEDLYRHGFEKIVFLAMSEKYEETNSEKMNMIYNYFIEEEYGSLREIPCYSVMIGKYFEENIIRENKNYVVTWCDKEFLYSYDRMHEHLKEKKLETDFLNVPLIAYEPCTVLFRYFMYGIKDKVEKYIKLGKEVDNSFSMNEEEFLLEQYKTYRLLERKYEKGTDALQYMPIDVKWNVRGYFNIIDGHHRCVFYWLKGLQSMPVRMKREDYVIWMNDMAFQNIKKILGKNQIIPAVRINHPFLQKYKHSKTEYGITFLDLLSEWLYNSKSCFQSVIELSEKQAYYARNLYRMKKAKKIVAIVEPQEEVELAKAVASLQYIPEEAVDIRSSLKEAVSIYNEFELGIICARYDVKELELCLDILNMNITKTIFWQSKLDSDQEKEYILKHSDFKHYTCLATKCIDGRFCEIGVFDK